MLDALSEPKYNSAVELQVKLTMGDLPSASSTYFPAGQINETSPAIVWEKQIR